MVRFRFLQIDVLIEPAYWLVLLLFCFQPSHSLVHLLLAAIGFCFSLLFHEYGHGLAALKLGYSPRIVLGPFGGCTTYPSYGLSGKQQFFITASGPLFTAFLATICYAVIRAHALDREWLYFFYWMMKINIYWLIVNLAPLLPLDGGHLAKYLLVKWRGNQGLRWSFALSNITAVAGVTFFLMIQNYMLAFLFFIYGMQNIQTFRLLPAAEKPDLTELYNQAEEALRKGEQKRAKKILRYIARSKNEPIRVQALINLARILGQEGDPLAGQQLLLSVGPEKLGNAKWLLCKLAYEAGNFSLAAQYAFEVYHLHPTYETAIMNARIFAQIDNAHLAAGWINTATQFCNAEETSVIVAHPAFSSVRTNENFQLGLGTVKQ
jgi:stage IV sporulation protein FB